MLYKRRTFSVSSIQNSGSQCAEKGHSGADSRDCCYCCGQKIAERRDVIVAELDLSRDIAGQGAG